MKERRVYRWALAAVLALILALTTGCGPQEPARYHLNVELVGDYPCMAWDVCVQDEYAFVATRDNALLILDISQPQRPVKVSSYVPGDIPKAVQVEQDYAYLLTDTGRYPNGNARLHIIDVSNPYRLQRMGECYLGTSPAEALSVKDAYAYAGSGNLYVVNVSDVSNPLLMRELYLGGRVAAVDVGDTLAYCAVQSPYQESKLVIVDISDPSQAKVAFSYRASQRAKYPYSFAFDIARQDSCLFISTERGLQVIDIAKPTRPKDISFHPLYRWPLSFSALCVADPYVYLTYCTTGLKIIDISDPTHPVEVGYYDILSRDVGKVCVKGSYVYVASLCALYIFQFTG